MAQNVGSPGAGTNGVSHGPRFFPRKFSDPYRVRIGVGFLYLIRLQTSGVILEFRDLMNFPLELLFLP